MTRIHLAAACLAIAVPAAQGAAQTVDSTHKGMSTGPLRQARLVSLPKGTLLRSGKLVVTVGQLNAEIAKAGAAAKAQLKGHEIVLLENMAVRALLKSEAAAWAAGQKPDASKQGDDALIRAYLQSVAERAKVTDAEMRAFYNGNKDMFGGAAYDSVANDLRSYLTGQSKQEAVTDHINGLGKRHPMEIDSAWCAIQAKTVLNNPVDKLRNSGKPALVDFGSTGCRPCDMLAPILDELRKTYAGKCSVLFVQVKDNPMLASRYGVQTIPVQVFFDKNGDEVFRHVGFWPKEQLVAKIAAMGVK